MRMNTGILSEEFPGRARAEDILREAETHNAGPWANHSRTVAVCAERIAAACGMDADKAYVLGLLHDIGRRFGTGHLRHVYDGWKYMRECGYGQAAKVCLTHSFCDGDLSGYIGRSDVSGAERSELETALKAAVYDDYDRLIQLCDALGGADGVTDMEERMRDVERRYGAYPPEKRNANRALKAYFETKAGRDIYEITGRPVSGQTQKT